MEKNRSLEESEERLRHMAHFDKLTGLPNRALFFERLERAKVESKRNSQSFALFFVDLDAFKSVNDTFGHETGDGLLKEVARRLEVCGRVSDTVARMVGDEFSVLLPLAAKDAAEVAGRKLKRALADAIETRWPVTFSIGMVTYTTAPESVECMIRQADQVMYEVKKSGKNELCSVVVHQMKSNGISNKGD